MEQVTVNLYTYDELSEQAKAHARDWWIQGETEIPWQQETFESLMKLYETANIKVINYSLGIYSHSYVKLDLDGDVRKLHGARALAWLENNLLWIIRISRADYLKNRKAYFGYGMSYRIGKIKPCPFTGYDSDEVFLESLVTDVKKGMSLGAALEALAQTYQNLLYDEWEYCQTEEYLSNVFSANEYRFTESGEFWG